jgi:hypothetical protein
MMNWKIPTTDTEKSEKQNLEVQDIDDDEEEGEEHEKGNGAGGTTQKTVPHRREEKRSRYRDNSPTMQEKESYKINNHASPYRR